jgi:parallel beta-helix repeat protein
VATYSQPGVFNALDYGLRTSGFFGVNAVNNAISLQNAINAALASANPSGAIVLIPSYSINPSTGANEYGAYPIDTSTAQQGPITVSGSQPILICGTGEGAQLSMKASSSADMFHITATAPTGAVTFQDLQISYDPLFSLHGTALTFGGAAAHKLFRVDVVNCQYPVAFNGTKGARMLQCYINYANRVLDLRALQIIGGSSDTSVSQCLFRCGVSNILPSFYGIYVDQATHIKITDTQIEDFGTGLLIQGTTGTTVGVSVVGSRMAAYGQCVEIKPTVTDASFVDCHFQASGAYTGSGPGIGIGIGNVINSQIDTIRFDSCSLTGNTSSVGYGLQIGGAQNIQIYGGDYSGNGAATGIAGIAVVGGASDIQIIGANCVGVETEAGHDTPALFQQYGILVTWGSDIQIVGVDCSGNGFPGTTYPGDGIHIDGSSNSVTNVTIVGVTAAGSEQGQAIDQNAGIAIISASNVVVKGCVLNGSYAYGLYLKNVTNAVVDACDVNGNTTGVYIDSGSTRIYVRNCNASAYGSITSAIFVYNPLNKVEITNCAGYNDQHTVFAVSSPPAGSFSGVTVANYYGPTVFYVKGGQVTVDSQVTKLTSGAFTLSPLENAQVAPFPGQPFLMIGN